MENKEEKPKIPQNDFCKIQPTIVATNRYDVYLNSLIDKPHYYFDFMEIMRSADAEDEVYIHLNNNGGYVDTAMQIINAIKDSSAKITTCVDGACHSAASLILLSGDEVKVSGHGTMLCHYYSGCASGKGNDIEKQVDFDKTYYKKFFKKIYKNFLTDDEIKNLIKGTDVWMDSKEILKRLKNIVKPKGL